MSSQLKWLIIILTSIGGLLFNFMVLDPLIMPDPCSYHTQEMHLVISLFYSISPYSGGHPEISVFNVFFFLFIGGYIGKLLAAAIDHVFLGLS